MEKINFNNNEAPYLSAATLNQLQTNIENAIEETKSKVLFENATGILGNVTLSESVANYEYLEIHYVSDNFSNSMTIRNPNNKQVCLFNNYCDNNKQCMYMSVYNISENNEVGTYGNNQYLAVTAVIGKNTDKEV